MNKFCKKRNEIIQFPMAEDYCVDCVHYDVLQDCWANELEVKCVNCGENVVELPTRFNVYKISFGSYYTDRKDKPIRVFFKDGQELDVSNLNVIIHDNGIEFLED